MYRKRKSQAMKNMCKGQTRTLNCFLKKSICCRNKEEYVLGQRLGMEKPEKMGRKIEGKQLI